MPKQQRVQYVRPSERSDQYEYEAKDAVRSQEEDRRKQETARKAGELATETLTGIDELLEDIDSVLEENALEFMNNWVQQSGE